MKRHPPLKALRVAKLRCEAAVTITITGKEGSGKSTAAEIICKALAAYGHNAICIEADDQVIGTKRHDEGKDDRLFLTVVEDSNVAYKPEAKAAEPEAAEKECDGDCEECGKGVPPILKALILHSFMKAARQGM